jgi:endopeptidase Clp ATP-binding regulatory subunit ClpX
MEKIPDQKEIEKELQDYLKQKYGDRVKLVQTETAPWPREAGESSRRRGSSGADLVRFDLKPEELYEYLDRYVVKQDQAKAVLATKVCTHFNRIRYERRHNLEDLKSSVGRIKNNIILIGPTGVGKTYMVKLIAKKLGVPFVKGDATKFSETGYVGGDVDDLVRDLVKEADGDLELAQYGIIYIDEIDKIASSANLIGPDVSRTGVQRALLKPMEETEVELKSPHDPISQIQAIEEYRRTGKSDKETINTRNILFIVSGAFNGLADIAKKRLKAGGIGFSKEPCSPEDAICYLGEVKPEDLLEYGFESEFVGRLPVVTVLEPLTEDDLYEILKNPHDPIICAKRTDFRSYDIDLRFTDEALKVIAHQAGQDRTGARGLVRALERVLIPFERKLPSTDIRHLVLVEEIAQNPEAELERLISNPDEGEQARLYQEMSSGERERLLELIHSEEARLKEAYGPIFTEPLIELVIEMNMTTGQETSVLFAHLFRLYGEVKSFESDFFERHGIHLLFDDTAVEAILKRSFRDGMSASQVCRDVSRDFDYGFKLVMDKTGQQQFIVPKEGVEQPEDYLNRMIRDTYRSG